MRKLIVSAALFVLQSGLVLTIAGRGGMTSFVPGPGPAPRARCSAPRGIHRGPIRVLYGQLHHVHGD